MPGCSSRNSATLSRSRGPFPRRRSCSITAAPRSTSASYHGKLHERFEPWRSAIRELAQLPNVAVKLGGLAMPCGHARSRPRSRPLVELLAAMWRPYIETCIEAFGAERGMFESNYPVDKWGASYATLWNAFKRLTHGASADEKRALYAGTAARVYGIEGILLNG